MRPALLVRSGEGAPLWVSPLECLKLAVGLSTFECCETNHTVIRTCQRPIVKGVLKEMIRQRVDALFGCKDTVPEARWTACFEMWWLRGFSDSSERARISASAFRCDVLCVNNTSWFDSEGFPVLAYASLYNSKNVVSDLLQEIDQISNKQERVKCLVSRVPKKGMSSLGVTGGLTAQMIAMGFGNTEIVSLLLEHGADPYEQDIAGNDALMMASIFGRTDNVKFWLEQFPDWDLERKNKVVGGVALGTAVYMGPNRLELVKVLLKHGASTALKNFSGASILTSLCSSEDCDPEIVELVLKSESESVNYRRQGQSLKWRNIYRLARVLVRTKIKKTGVMISLARACGSTALHYAVRRGDVDVVNILLRNGADPEIIDGINKSPVDYCDAFPELRGALKRVIQQRKEGKQVTLHRRNSTATDMKFPMYLVPLDQLERLYGGTEPRYDRIEAHQELLRRGELVRWFDLPIDAHIIFLSHEHVLLFLLLALQENHTHKSALKHRWVGWHHPDPHGVQLKTFLRVMKRLRSGEISQVETNPFHTLVYKTNRVVGATEWKTMLATAYVRYTVTLSLYIHIDPTELTLIFFSI